MTFHADDIDRYLKQASDEIPSQVKSCITKVIHAALGIDSTWHQWTIKSDSPIAVWVKEYAQALVKDYCAKNVPKIKEADLDRVQHNIVDKVNNAIGYEFEKLASEYVRQYIGPAIEAAVKEKCKLVAKVVDSQINKAFGINSDIANPEFGSKAIEDMILKTLMANPASIELLKKLKK